MSAVCEHSVPQDMTKVWKLFVSQRPPADRKSVCIPTDHIWSNFPFHHKLGFLSP